MATSRVRQAVTDDSDLSNDLNENPLVRKLHILRISLVVLQTILFCTVTFVATIIMINGEDDKANAKYVQFQYYFTGSLFSAFLLTYLVMFIVLVCRLQSNFRRFYEREKHKVIQHLFTKG